MTRTFTTVIYKEDDWYVADCPGAGTASQGKAIEEATELYLEEFPAPETIHPLPAAFGVATYA